MQPRTPTVFVIDPDERTRTAIGELLSTMSVPCRMFGTGREFFDAFTGDEGCCVVLEVRIPDMSGWQIQQRLAALPVVPPLVFISGQTDIALAVDLLRRGAVHYLQKPLRTWELLNPIQEALALVQSRRRTWQRKRRVAQRMALLTSKEREVLRLIAAGEPSHEIANCLSISRRAMELRRASLMKKLKLNCPWSLVRFALLARRHEQAARQGTPRSATERAQEGIAYSDPLDEQRSLGNARATSSISG